MIGNAEINEISTVVSNLSGGVEYEFQVRAMNIGGNSDWTESIVVSTVHPPIDIAKIFQDIQNTPPKNTSVSYRTVQIFGSANNIVNQGCVLATNGKIIGIPDRDTAVLEVDPVERTATTLGSAGHGGGFFGGVLAQNEKIYGIPSRGTTVLEIDPILRTVSTFGELPTGQSKWRGGVGASNGKIIGIPYASDYVLEIDPISKTISYFGDISQLGLSFRGWSGGVIAPNGKIYGILFAAV
jgi:hypothetical protein